jgi:hypothetical protein
MEPRSCYVHRSTETKREMIKGPAATLKLELRQWDGIKR